MGITNLFGYIRRKLILKNILKNLEYVVLYFVFLLNFTKYERMKCMNKFLKGVLIGAIFSALLMASMPAIAESIDVAFNKIKVSVNGKPVTADNVLINGRTYVPLRAISDILNKDVVWDPQTSTANINDKGIVKEEPNKEVINKIESYLEDIETQTNRKIPQNQKDLIITYVKNNPVKKLSSDETTLHRKEFDSKKTAILKEWTSKTGQSWPTYLNDVLSESGKLLRKAGNNYDAHHIIELSYGGPNVWWNMHPAAYPEEHQGGIHRKDGIANELFED